MTVTNRRADTGWAEARCFQLCPGFFSPHLHNAARGGRLVAMDLQPEMSRLARDRLTDRRTAAVVSADATELPFAACTFDVVFVAVMLGEVPDVGRAVREMHRVLVPGGTASFSETRRDSDFLSLPRLRQLVEPAGFELELRRGHRGSTSRTSRPYRAVDGATAPRVASPLDASVEPPRRRRGHAAGIDDGG